MNKCIFVFLYLITLNTWGKAQVYFNHREATTYQDPYRGILRQGDNLEAEILSSVSNAKKRIWIAVQELRLPLVALALVAKKNKGIDVRVILENKYNHEINSTDHNNQSQDSDSDYEVSKSQELMALVDLNKDGNLSLSEKMARDAIFILKKNKIPVIDDASSSAGSGIMHHKFVIIDHDITLISSANFTLSCIHGDLLNHTSRGNSNALIRIKNSKFQLNFEEEFSEMWGNGEGGNFGLSKIQRKPEKLEIGQSNVIVNFSPSSQKLNWNESSNGLITSTIENAKSSVDLALFVFSEQKITNALNENVNLKIEALIEKRFAYRYYSELLDLRGVQYPDEKCRIEPHNAPWIKPVKLAGTVNLPYGDILHHKFAVIDNKKVIFGSHNWSVAANRQNDEFVVVFSDEYLASEFKKEFNRLKKFANYALPSFLTKPVTTCDVIQ